MLHHGDGRAGNDGLNLGELTALYRSLDYISPLGYGLLAHSRLVLIGVCACEEAVFLLAGLLLHVLAYLELNGSGADGIGYSVAALTVEACPLHPEVARLTALVNKEESAVGDGLGGVLEVRAGSEDELELHGAGAEILDGCGAAKLGGDLSCELVDKGLAVLTDKECHVIGRRLYGELDCLTVIINGSARELLSKTCGQKSCKAELYISLSDVCVGDAVTECLFGYGPLYPRGEGGRVSELNGERIVPLALVGEAVGEVVLIHCDSLERVAVFVLEHGHENSREAIDKGVGSSVLDYLVMKKVDHHYQQTPFTLSNVVIHLNFSIFKIKKQ